jgi:hypothetical protein
VPPQDPARGQALGPRRPDVVLGEDLEDARAGQPGGHPGLAGRDGDPGQDHPAEPLAGAARDAYVAGLQGQVPGRGEVREHVQQQQRQQERGDRQRGQHAGADGLVDPRARPQRARRPGQDPGREPQHHPADQQG